MKFWELMIGACITLLPLTLNAADQGLDQVPSVSILIENLRDDALKCGISRDLLDAAARLPLASSPLVVDSAAFNSFYIAIFALRTGDNCAVFIHVELLRPFSPAPGRLVYAASWENGGLLTGDAASMPKRVSDFTELATKQFIAAWLAARTSKKN